MTNTSFSRAFSLIEAMLVFALISGISLYVVGAEIKNISRARARNDAMQIEYALRQTRGNALARICHTEMCFSAAPHGVHINNRYVQIFKEILISSTTQYYSFPLSGRSAVATTTFLFSSNTGHVLAPGTLILQEQNGLTRYVTVNAAGMIERGLYAP